MSDDRTLPRTTRKALKPLHDSSWFQISIGTLTRYCNFREKVPWNPDIHSAPKKANILYLCSGRAFTLKYVLNIHVKYTISYVYVPYLMCQKYLRKISQEEQTRTVFLVYSGQYEDANDPVHFKQFSYPVNSSKFRSVLVTVIQESKHTNYAWHCGLLGNVF